MTSDLEIITKDAFTYSDQDRLKTQTHQINGGTIEVIANNSYDELGQLISKKVGNTILDPTQKVDYTYNIRGWMTGINDVTALSKTGDPKDLFAFKINYNNMPGITGGKALYNGNIAETFWISSSEATPVVRGYAYLYDNLNRLRTSFYKRDATVSNAYSENLTYDKNGKIGSLSRNGNSETATQIDALVYTYTNSNTTNQLLKVVDSAPATTKIYGFADSAANTDDYSYDANGNMTKDNNKNITAITYNHLNLPTKITFATTGNIAYIYNAAGQKVQKIVKEGANETITDYLAGYQYVKTPATSTMLKFFPTAEGYVEVSGSSYKYVYQYKDHLGNIRLSYDKNLAIQDENQYYPFGLLQKRQTDVIVESNYKYRYNGKELQDENIGGFQLNLYDYGARNYDPALGRWMSIDPLAEQMRRWSPYNYCFNNPLRFKDPDGMGPNDHIFDARGNFLRDTKVGNSVKIQIGDKQYSPSQLDTSRGSRGAISKIGAYYAGKVGTDPGTIITTGTSDKKSSDNPASTKGEVISINTNGGFSKSLDNISDFKSVMKHENGHKENNEDKNFKSDLSNHADVYIDQMKDNGFSTTSDEYRTGIAGSFGNYLLNMDQSTEFSSSDILKKINTFNNTNKGGIQIKRQGENYGPAVKGNWSLELIYKGGTASIDYEKVKN
ncbi:RHS repeat-associated core domain-containing protein [Flavobacterium circumlabens]|uniref:RHS repeat-associated protein n=1 Tax=Flavobacterium circumlabens TaxID=2133765 RepID=A0ABY2ASZ3_9FLAO|nr:RHS repeat-associated core domain-containing protein [Flavobacterium circumlabens]TCN49911.1 RHS repeat-associated protein [Flavobacterium circumlabens]